MAKPSVTQLDHVALYAPDPDALAEFYEGVLGLGIVARSKLSVEGIRSSIYLSCTSEETAYQLAIFANPDIHHTAFEVSSLANLKALYGLIVEHGLRIRWVLNHGISLAFYFYDPAGNLIKLFWLTGEKYPQPFGCPIDLTQPEAVLRQDVANMLAKLKTLKGD